MKQAKTFLGTSNWKRFREYINLIKNDTHILTPILSGHCKLNWHMSTVRIPKEFGFCRQQDEIPTHLFSNRETFQNLKKLHLEARQIADGVMTT